MNEANVTFDKDCRAAIGVFEGFISPTQFQDIANKLHDERQKNYSNKQLNNIHSMKVLSQEIQTWINDIWFPKAKQTGLKFLAFVVPVDVFGKLSMDAANKQAMDTFNIEIQYFDNEANAKAWLKSK